MPDPQLCNQIDQLVSKHIAELTAVREHLHANPELSWQEEETTKYLQNSLHQHGIQSEMGPRDRGLKAEILFGESNPTSPCAAIRGDIDAIPVAEETGLPFSSRVPGVMHACGHDVHATILLGNLLVLNELNNRNLISDSGRIRGLFQPAEEIAQGASAFIDAGYLDNVDAIFAFHVDPSRDVGRVGVKTGVQTAFCDEIRITISGEGGHSARPHETDDAIYASIQLVNALYGHLPRTVDSRQPVVLTFCTIAGGSSSNIIPHTVELVGTLRALDIDARKTARETIERVVKGTQEITRTEIELAFIDKVPGVINDEALMKLVTNASAQVLGHSAIDHISASVGGEDFSFYTEKVKGAFTRLGCGSEQVGYWDLHSPHFDVDPKTIEYGVRIMVRSVLDWLQTQNSHCGTNGKAESTL